MVYFMYLISKYFWILTDEISYMLILNGEFLFKCCRAGCVKMLDMTIEIIMLKPLANILITKRSLRCYSVVHLCKTALFGIFFFKIWLNLHWRWVLQRGADIKLRASCGSSSKTDFWQKFGPQSAYVDIFATFTTKMP